MKSKLGYTKDGARIVARCCGEDNSGNVSTHDDITFRLHTTYPHACERLDNGEDGDALCNTTYTNKAEAVEALKSVCGWEG